MLQRALAALAGKMMLASSSCSSAVVARPVALAAASSSATSATSCGGIAAVGVARLGGASSSSSSSRRGFAMLSSAAHRPAMAAAAAAPARRGLHVARSAAAAAEPVAAAAAHEPAAREEDTVYETQYDPDYHNFVALTGTLANPTRRGWGSTPVGDSAAAPDGQAAEAAHYDGPPEPEHHPHLLQPERCYSFTLRVARADMPPGTPPVYDALRVDAWGALGDDAARKLGEGMQVAVQGRLVVDTTASPPAVRVYARDIGRVFTPSPEALVEGGYAPADPAQFAAPPQAGQPPLQQQQQQYYAQHYAADGGGGGGYAAAPRLVPGMPDQPATERERAWMELFTNPGAFYDNRIKKTNPRAPDFKHKSSGEALWLSSRDTPQWVQDNAQKLPGNIPYEPTPQQQQQQQAGGSNGGGGARPAFIPDDFELSERERAWADVFTHYNSWWDNRVNKFNPRAPDFKHKTNGAALWLTSRDTPQWALDNVDSALPAPPPPRRPAMDG